MKESWKVGLAIIGLSLIFYCCSKDNWYTVEFNNNIEFPEHLSSLDLFEDLTNLTPKNDVYIYELSSVLFTDYAEKQRLVKLPSGSSINPTDQNLPEFPDGTILAKTFYYYHNAQYPERGKNIIETRILLKKDNIWNIGTYLWNDDQTEAIFIEDGHNTNVKWIDKNGVNQSISYAVPKSRDCASCHQNNEVIIPIGPKLANLNRNITIKGKVINQLKYFQDEAILKDFDSNEINVLPSYNDPTLSLEKRGRAYLDINCAHCHTYGGIVEDEWYNFDYETPLSKTGILWNKDAIVEQVSSGKMPYIGTTVVDKEGLQLLTEFIESL